MLLASSIFGYAKSGTEQVASGFERSIWAGMPASGQGKLRVIEQVGSVWIVVLKTGQRSKRPFLDIRTDVSRAGNEEGLLGLAFSPDFEKSGHFYVNFTDKEHHTRIVRFTSDNRTETDPGSAAEILPRYKQDFRGHNGGWIAFGPDGMLYIGN